MREIASPERAAAASMALSANILSDVHDDSPYGSGRFILLCDDDSADTWGAPFRVVCYATAPLELEIGEDALLADVAWSWLMDALEERNARFTFASGTATKIISTGFGALSAQGSGAQIELRASWTPIGEDISEHVIAWGELLCMLAGLPQQSEDVTSLTEQKLKRDR